MAQFLLNFHHFPLPKNGNASPEVYEAINKQWQAYIGGIAGQGKFIGTQRLDQAGFLIGPDGRLSDVVTEGEPLTVGTLTLTADNLNEAVEMAKGCPVLSMGGRVEVRPVLDFEL